MSTSRYYPGISLTSVQLVVRQRFERGTNVERLYYARLTITLLVTLCLVSLPCETETSAVTSTTGNQCICRYANRAPQQGTRNVNLLFKNFVGYNIVTDLLKALQNSGHVVPQQDDATVLWKRFLLVGACTCDVMLYGACAGDVRQE
jgi:hypothetical protein